MTQSPCVKECLLVKTDYEPFCLGCYRLLSEIIGWGSTSEEEKHQILSELAARRREIASTE